MQSDITFFHSFREPEVIHGLGPYENLKARADAILGDVAGKSVLDIGAWDGFFSFEAEARGAKSVLATDHFCWSGPGWGTKEGFDYVHSLRKSQVQSLDIDLFDLSPETVGVHDVVLFLGVLYHLKNPFGGLERAASVCGDTLIVETAGAMFDTPEPVMRFFLGDALNGDGTNFFAPNAPCLTHMLREVGFTQTHYIKSPDGPDRLLVIARR